LAVAAPAGVHPGIGVIVLVLVVLGALAFGAVRLSARRTGRRRAGGSQADRESHQAAGLPQGGMLLLARRAREELNAPGDRPRRSALSGPGALTPGEYRIARPATHSGALSGRRTLAHGITTETAATVTLTAVDRDANDFPGHAVLWPLLIGAWKRKESGR
jgi:hypothetical protein